MKVLYLSVGIAIFSVLLVHQPGTVDGQTVLSPFVYLCRQTCGGYGAFRRMCCYLDELCCSKPNECPEDPTQDVLLPMCQSCTQDVDCMWTAKCCDHETRKCCTPLRSTFFRKTASQRAKEKVGALSSNTTKGVKDEAEEDPAK